MSRRRVGGERGGGGGGGKGGRGQRFSLCCAGVCSKLHLSGSAQSSCSDRCIFVAIQSGAGSCKRCGWERCIVYVFGRNDGFYAASKSSGVSSYSSVSRGRQVVS